MRAMRFVITVIVGGLGVGALLPQMPIYLALNLAPAPAYALIALLAFLVGATVSHRGWLAAGAAYLIGVALWIALYLRPSPPWAPSDNWGIETWIGFALNQVLVPTVVAGGLGAIGNWTGRAMVGLRLRNI